MQFYRRKKKSRSPLRSGMAIYGPDRYKRHAFCDGKRVARSPLRSKTSTFDPPTPEIVVLHERDERFFSTHDFVREVRHFLARRGSNTAKLDILYERSEGFLSDLPKY